MGLTEGGTRRDADLYPRGLRNRLRSAADTARLTGLAGFATRVLPWSLAREYSIYRQDLDRIIEVPPPTVPCLIRQAGREDIPNILSLRRGYYSHSLLEKRFEAGHLAFIGCSGDRPVYCQWAITGTAEVPYLHGRLVLGRDEAFSDEIFVHPAYRRSGIYINGSVYIREALREKGFRTLYSAVASWNDVPRKVMVKMGMTEIARLRYRNVPGFRKARWSGRVEVREDGSLTFHASR